MLKSAYYKTMDPPTHPLQMFLLASCYNSGVSCCCIPDPHNSLSSHLLLGILSTTVLNCIELYCTVSIINLDFLHVEHNQENTVYAKAM